jgi:ParB family chromosome partitioning protein
MTADPKKRGLGRGLDALFGEAKKEEQRRAERAEQKGAERAESRPADKTDSKIIRGAELERNAPAPAARATAPARENTNNGGPRKMPVERLTPGKFQPRRQFNDDAIDQLADSIAVHGILQPILVRPLGNPSSSTTIFEIIAGERRWRAAQKAQLHEVPVVIQEMDDKQALEIALIENLQREDLTPLEEAEGYQRLMDEFGHTQEQLSRQLGKSRSLVANTLRLLKLPTAVRSKIQSGALSAGHARALIGANDAEKLAEVVIKRGLSVRQTEKLVKQATEGKFKPTKGKRGTAVVKKDVDLLALEEKMTALLGLKVAIEGDSVQAGRLVIEYKSLDQLDDVLARLSLHPR